MNVLEASHVELFEHIETVLTTAPPLVDAVFAVMLYFLLCAADQLEMNDVDLLTAVTRGRNEYNSTISQHDQGVN